VKNSPFQYFPERLLANRPQFARLYAQLQNADFENDIEAHFKVREELRKPVPAWHKLENIPPELWAQAPKIDRSDPAAADPEGPQFKAWSAWEAQAEPYRLHYPRLDEEVTAFNSLLHFQRAGRNIFSIAPGLQELLNHTAVGNIRWEDIQLPYPTFFLYFGPETGIELPLDAYEHKHGLEQQLEDAGTQYQLDGAFVRLGTGSALDIGLTFRDKRESFTGTTPVTKDFRFPIVPLTLDFTDAEGEAQGRTFDEAALIFADIWDAKGETGEIEYGYIRARLASNEFTYDAEREQYQLFDKALILIVNSLCYLTLAERQVRTGTTSEQADKLLSEIRQAKNKQRRQPLLEKLGKVSYSTVRFCGENLLPAPSSLAGAGNVVPHWRRGHWRKQPVGSGRTETRLLWIRPTIVRRDKGDPAQGHVYEV
jgi:hypothetical protein